MDKRGVSLGIVSMVHYDVSGASARVRTVRPMFATDTRTFVKTSEGDAALRRTI